MNLSAPFIKRPIGTTLLALGLALAGALAFNLLPVASLPQVDFPTISVQAALPGASPEVMGTTVATPLERQLGRIAGITEMTSSSTLGQTRIVLQFDLARNIDGAARDVQAAINASLGQLPTNLPSNPTYRKVNPADAPILILALTSDIYTTGQLYDAAASILQQKLAQIEGIGQVTVGGSSLPAVRVELNPTALNSYGIGLTAVGNTLAAANINQPKGQLQQGTTYAEIMTRDQLFKAYEYAPLIITYRHGSPVRVSDVAEVRDDVEDLRNAGLSNGRPAVLLVLFKQPGANVIQSVEQVRQCLPQLRASIPAAMNLEIMIDRTTTIRTALHDIEITLMIAMILVILVTYLFLGNIRAMLVPGVAVPLSLLGTFGVMYLLGYSLDNLSLMALTISTGFVVDDAVVVLENITRHIENGSPPRQAALQGVKEVYFTVLSMSLSLIAVFIPILLMSGLIGRLFREFAVTLSAAILISMLVSLTVTPMMCAFILRPAGATPQQSKMRLIERVHYYYQRSLIWALHYPKWMIFATLMTLLCNIFLFFIIPKGFFPQQDTGRITASIQAEQKISFQGMKNKLTAFVTLIKQNHAVENVVGFVGSGGGGNTNNAGAIFISLKPLLERKISADAVINQLRQQLVTITGAKLYMQAAQDLMMGGRQGNAQFQYTLSAANLDDLNTWTPRIQEKMARLPGVADVNSDQLNQGLQMFINVNHDTAYRFGITPQAIDAALYAAFGQSQVSTLYTAMNQYHVVMEVAPRYWQYPSTLHDIYVSSTAGKLVPLAVFADFNPAAALLSVNHQGQAPAATLSFNLLPGAALGDVVNQVSKTIEQMHLPAGLQGSFQGTAQAFQASLANEPYLITIALLTVYIVLGMLYESLIHPITILSTLPSAGVGALLALLLTGTDFSIMALIGIILLIGIVKKNAIMMIDFALHKERTENKTPQAAIYQAALLRFRPIMMTTLAAMLGALPLVLGRGLGSELRRPLGIAIVGGLLVSQLLTLYTTPVIYLYLGRFVAGWRGRRKSPGAEQVVPAP
jgi:multidrug efflux pump